MFARFLDTCACCSGEEGVLEAVRALDQRGIKGLGPAAANLLYFLHPTIAPPFNTPCRIPWEFGLPCLYS